MRSEVEAIEFSKVDGLFARERDAKMRVLGAKLNIFFLLLLKSPCRMNKGDTDRRNDNNDSASSVYLRYRRK